MPKEQEQEKEESTGLIPDGEGGEGLELDDDGLPIVDGEGHDDDHSPTLDEVATELGWNPNYEGDGAKTAVEFILASKPIAQSKSKQIRGLERQIQEMSDKFRQFAVKYSQSQMNERRQELESRLVEATENNDVVAVKKIATEQTKLEAEAELETANPRKAQFEAGEQDFLERNPWYKDKRRMRLKANSYAEALLKDDPEIDPVEYFEEIEGLIKAEFPNEFENPRRGRRSAVGGDTPPNGDDGGNPWRSAVRKYPGLEDDFMDFVHEGVFKDTKKERDAFAKDVLAQEQE